jgi:hypothetical protein
MVQNFLQFARSARKLRAGFLQRAGLSSEASHLDWNTHEDFFSYTRGRFVLKEQDELARRYVRFGMKELAKIACESVGSECCVSVEKFPDGMYNKAFLFTMQDGKQVVGKVPNPNAGRPHYTTASEVATMDFVRQSRLALCFSCANGHLRPEIFLGRQFPRRWHGVLRLTRIPLGRNTLSWKRCLEFN